MYKIELTDMQLRMIFSALDKSMGIYHIKAEDEEKKAKEENIAKAYYSMIRLLEETILSIKSQIKGA
jgi:hypothetical protein